jgi:hypothetical protein
VNAVLDRQMREITQNSEGNLFPMPSNGYRNQPTLDVRVSGGSVLSNLLLLR